MAYPGPCCESLGITTIHLEEREQFNVQLTNGATLEIFDFVKNSADLNNSDFVQLISLFDASFISTKTASVISKVQRLVETKKKLQKKKKVKGFKDVSDLLGHQFTQISSQQGHSRLSCVDEQPKQSESKTKILSDVNTTCDNLTSDVASQTDDIVNNSDVTKAWNLQKHLKSKREKKLTKLSSEVVSVEKKIKTLESRVGHYSVKNVNKRDETAKKTRRELANARLINRKLSAQVKKCSTEHGELKNKVKCLSAENLALKQKEENNIAQLEEEKARKVNAQKANSKLRGKVVQLKQRQEATKCEEIKKCYVEAEPTVLSDTEAAQVTDEEADTTCIKTKKSDGSYNENVRLCVIQLAGLEVAVEKVTPVIEVVANNIFNKQFDKSQLPNKTTVQTIVDEGHYIAKALISKKINDCENWGINRDGTSRRKQKIVDTAVTLDNGEITSLGFTHVARETAKTITDVTKKHLMEMAAINSTSPQMCEDYVINSLNKLAFTMSDRASNEKLADTLLNEWRDGLLQQCQNDEEVHSVQRFHCMAHVLLGFHRYVSDNLKDVDSKVKDEHGPIGRDSLPIFKFKPFFDRCSVMERVVRTTSDTFGPVGDHLGLRDKWEAFCAKKGLKSTIGNYKDNRFNGLFQTATEVLVHRQDFLKVIETVKAPNKKIQAVAADLASPQIVTMLAALSVAYVKITGPYWELVTSGNVPYLELHTPIQALHSYLEECVTRPGKMMEDGDILEDVDTDLQVKVLDIINSQELQNSLFSQTIAAICQGMIKTINRQLVDFLEGGVYGSAPSKEDLQRTSFAHVTNLGCEHHFGDLDSSQKRRPNASMHHHSSVQLLKRNRIHIKNWLGEMDSTERERLWKDAIKGGKSLRRKHKEHERAVQEEISEMMDQPVKKRQRRASVAETPIEDDIEEEYETAEASVNDYVIVAYQDAWYPGCVMDKKDDSYVVKYMKRGRKAGTFLWPARDDVQETGQEFVLASGMVPECMNSGRQWLFKDSELYETMYCRYKKLYF